MSEQGITQVSTLKRPANDDKEAWKEYWKAQGQPWRTEPEIDLERQKYLDERRSITPDIEQGIYPFKDIEPKLSRADVEWLLATHENGRGPIDWNDENQRERLGLDLRGAYLKGLDLKGLPLAHLRGMLLLNTEEWGIATRIQGRMAIIQLEEADLRGAHLEGAELRWANMKRALLHNAHLEQAKFDSANLELAELHEVHAEEADFRVAHLESAFIYDAHMEGAIFRTAQMRKARLAGVHLEGANLYQAHLEEADLRGAHLEGAQLGRAHLEGAHLLDAHFEGKELPLDDLDRLRKWNGDFPALLQPADLKEVFFDAGTNLDDATFGEEKYGFALLDDVHWGEVNLSKIDLKRLKMRGNDYKSRYRETSNVEMKRIDERLDGYQLAARSNRQLAVALQLQGLNEDAARFTYCAQLLQRKAFWNQRKFGQYLFSLFLDLLAGYGYKPWRSFVAYLLVITTFAVAYFIIGSTVGPVLSPLGSVVFSMTSFHGRGFFPGGITLDDPLTVVAALEAFIGLLIEVTFIATLTQRLFGK